MERTYVRHLTHYFPERVLDNAFFEGIMDTSDDWIRERLGILERRVMSDYRGSFPVFEIGRRAVDKLIERTSFEIGEVDLIVSCSCNDDLQFPGPGNMLSEHYGLEVPAFHMKNGCSSVVYGMQVARGLLATGAYRNVLLVNGEPFTRFTDYGDRSSAVLFGDAGTAMVLSSEEGELEVLDVEIGGRGSMVINATAPGAVPDKGIHEVLDPQGNDDWHEGVQPAWGRFQQDGRAVYDFVVNTMPAEILGFLERTGSSVDDIDWFIGHQANLVMLEALCEKLGVAPDKHLYNIDLHGNMSSAGWVTVLSQALEDKHFETGDVILGSVFGAGLGWGSTLLRMA